MKEVPESLVAVAIVWLVSGALLPLFLKLGLGILTSAGLAIGCGILVVAALVIRVWIIDGLPVWRRPRVEPRQQAGGENRTDV
jgi:hypothetical protein